MLKFENRKRAPLVPPISVSELFVLSCVGHKDDVVINQNEVDFTRRQLLADMKLLAKAFLQLDVKAGDIMTVAFDRPLYDNVLVFLAANSIGAAVVFLDERVPFDTLVNYLAEFGSPLVVTYKAQPEEIDALRQAAPGLKHVMNLDGGSDIQGFSVDGTPVVQIAARYTRRIPNNAFKADNLALVTFTSGSSSGPKAVAFTNRSLVAGAIYNKTASGVKMWDKRYHTWMQYVRFCYPYGFWVSTMSPILGGGKVYLTPDISNQTLDYYLSKNPDTIFGVPAFIELLSKHLSADVELTNLKMFASGGERLEVSTAEKAMELFERHGAREAVLCNGYGLAEVLGLVSTSVGQSYHPGTVGKVPAGVEVMVVESETGEELGFDETGVICVHGTHMLKGYFNRPEVDAQKFFEADGRRFLRTGDIGSIGRDGFVKLIGRSMFFINNIPAKVYYEYVRGAVEQSQLVAASYVVSIPDKEYEFAACAFVVLKEGVAPNDEARRSILQTASEPFWVGRDFIRLRPHEIPRRIVFLDAMPLTAAEKVDFRKLEQLAEEL